MRRRHRRRRGRRCSGHSGRRRRVGESIVENEDDTFPGVHAVYRTCSAEWLWHCILCAAAPATPNPPAFAPADPLVRVAVAAFVELGEGTVQHVLVVAGERGDGGGGPQRDYTGITTVRFVKSADRRRRRSLIVESADAFEIEEDAGAYTNNTVNSGAYARAGYTNTITTADEYVNNDFEE
ncbi:hypothetical protein DFH09DRAFT_1316125 [Mycena vulgaris]|nr:hypothetical protein DFH09DRAFT_1316125 [Mycena vulgaris]